MATISSPGSGSGIDVAGLVSSIISAESEPVLSRLDLRAAELQTRFSAMGQLKAALSSFADTVTRIRDGSGFGAKRANVTTAGDSVVAAASVSDSAPNGTFSLEVLALAEPHKQSTAGFANADVTFGAGTLVLGSGANAFSVAVDSTDSLSDIATSINGATDNDSIAASVVQVDDGLGGTQSKLVLSALSPGLANSLSVSAVDSDGVDNLGLSSLFVGLSDLQAAADASVKIDGRAVSSASNTLSEAVSGLTLHLQRAAPGQPVTISVTDDVDAATRELTNFVETFNGLRNAINALTNYDPARGERGVLLGDGLTRGLDSALRRELSSGIDGPIGSLADLGIATSADGTLSVDAGKLGDAFDQNYGAVIDLLAGDSGLAQRIEGVIDDFLGPDGVFEAREEAIAARLDVIGTQRESLARRMAIRESSLFAQFNAMDALVLQLQATSTFLSQQFSALEALVSNTSANNGT